MLVILPRVVDDSACDLHFRQKVKVPKNKELLATLFQLSSAELLVRKEIVGVLGLRISDLPAILVLDLEVSAVFAICNVLDIFVQLNHEQTKVYVGKFIVKPSQYQALLREGIHLLLRLFRRNFWSLRFDCLHVISTKSFY